MDFQINDLNLHYEIYGQGTSLVILHGLGGNILTMSTVLESLFDENSSVQRIYLDLPGMGKSQAHLDFAHSDTILSVLKQFIMEKVQSPFLLAGYSYGGYLTRALSMDSELQTLGLFLLAPMVLPDHSARRLPAVDWVHETELFQKSLENYNACVEPADEAFMAELNRHYSLSWNVLDSAHYEKPVLILLGKQDSIVGYEDQLTLLKDYPRATLAILDLAGHNLQFEQRELFVSMVKNWLERCKN